MCTYLSVMGTYGTAAHGLRTYSGALTPEPVVGKNVIVMCKGKVSLRGAVAGCFVL